MSSPRSIMVHLTTQIHMCSAKIILRINTCAVRVLLNSTVPGILVTSITTSILGTLKETCQWNSHTGLMYYCGSNASPSWELLSYVRLHHHRDIRTSDINPHSRIEGTLRNAHTHRYQELSIVNIPLFSIRRILHSQTTAIPFLDSGNRRSHRTDSAILFLPETSVTGFQTGYEKSKLSSIRQCEERNILAEIER